MERMGDVMVRRVEERVEFVLEGLVSGSVSAREIFRGDLIASAICFGFAE
jgi:hypothetical protein